MAEPHHAREMAEVRRSFVREVARRSPLPAHVTVESAASFVVGAFAERLTRGGAHVLLDALPAAIGSLFERSIEEHGGPPSRIDRSELKGHRRHTSIRMSELLVGAALAKLDKP